MDVAVVLLLILHSFGGTELLEPSAQPTNFSLPEDNGVWPYVSMLLSNETEELFSSQESVTPYNTTNATMNNTETDLGIIGSNETWTSKEDTSDYGKTFDNASTNDTNLNITDTKDITNNTDTSKDEMGSGFSDVESGEATPSPGYNITKFTNPEDITTITTIATTTNGINSTTTSTASTTTSSSTTLKEGLGDKRDIVYTENNRAVDSAEGNTRSSNSTALAIVIGTAMAVGVVSLIVYILKKRRGHRDFNHRKLVEDLPAGPVLRLDSYETLGMGTLAFNNPVLQGDDIHMDHMNQH